MKRTLIVTALALLVGAPWSGNLLPRATADEEWETRTMYYEDDAWWDVSEWLDGNDYNPTDEVFGRWDNESYNPVRNDDQDNDYAGSDYASSTYGYREGNDDDWYYDYYDDGYGDYSYDNQSDGVYGDAYRYYDFDSDGLYDAYANFHDWDHDGSFEDYTYYSLGDPSDLIASQEAEKQARQEAQSMAKEGSSKRFQLSGEIEQTKKVDVRGQKHLVAHVKMDQGAFAVDLGPAEKASQWNLSQGDKLTAQGPVTKVGDRGLMIAKSIQLQDGKQQSIDRSRNKITGKVKSLKTVTVRNAEHQLALVNADERDEQVLVDLGRKDRLKRELSEGDEVTIHGVPVRIKEKPAMMAQKIAHDGETTKIDRRQSKSANEQASSSSDRKRQTAQSDESTSQR